VPHPPAYVTGLDSDLGKLRAEFEGKDARARDYRVAFENAREKAIADRVDLAKDADRYRELQDLRKRFDGASDEAQEALGRWTDAVSGGKGHRAATGKGREGRLDGIGKAFIDSLGGKELKALTTGASVVPSFWDSRIRDLPQRQLFLRSLIPTLRADSDLVSFLRQTVATHAAAPVAAGGLKPTSTYTVERVDQPVRVIAHVTEALDRSLLSDQDALVDFLDQQLRLGVLLGLEQQIISGSGTAPNLRGILNTVGVGSVTRNVAGNESRTDAIYRALTTVRLNFFEPDGIVLHPNDWQEIRLQKNLDGDYQTGDVIEADPDRLWGKEIITSPVITEGTALVGAFAVGATIWEREENRVTFAETGLGGGTDELFVRNLVVWRGESRVAFGVERPAAFCQVLAI